MALPVTRALAISAAFVFITGCAGGSSPLINPGRTTANRSAQQPVATRTFHSTGLALMAALPKKVLYVSDLQNNRVVLFDPTTSDPKQVGQITGLNGPVGLAIDTKGVLYVANQGANTVAEYEHGATTPFFTIRGGSLSYPFAVAVDSGGNVFVTNGGDNTLLAYHAHRTMPYATISIGGEQLTGVAVDSKGNVYVAKVDNTLWLIKAGTTKPKLILTGLSGPIGVAIGAKDELHVANFTTNTVNVYASGSSTPSYTITTSIKLPTLNGTGSGGLFFQSNYRTQVVLYKGTSRTPYATITTVPQPNGVAGYPGKASSGARRLTCTSQARGPASSSSGPCRVWRWCAAA